MMTPKEIEKLFKKMLPRYQQDALSILTSEYATDSLKMLAGRFLGKWGKA